MKRIKERSLGDAAVQQISQFIVDNGLRVGDLIPTESELTQRLGISRTAVREALKGLESLGVVEARSGVGRRLRHFNFDSILQTLRITVRTDRNNFRNAAELRMVLEPAFFARDIGRYTRDDIEHLRQLLVRFADRAISETEREAFHTDFHCYLYRYAENELLTSMIQIFSNIRLRLGPLVVDKEIEDSVQEHEKLVGAIEAGDADGARTAMEEHLRDPLAQLSDS